MTILVNYFVGKFFTVIKRQTVPDLFCGICLCAKFAQFAQVVYYYGEGKERGHFTAGNTSGLDRGVSREKQHCLCKRALWVRQLLLDGNRQGRTGLTAAKRGTKSLFE
ncbi:MAG: hypothetical protein AAGF26_12360 [Cyanobacteria bacterium P01_G01_bin.49]